MVPQGYDAAGFPGQRTPPSPVPASRSAMDLGGPLPPQPTALKQQQEASGAYVPTYKLSRQVTSVPDLWREWTEGLGGLPSVMALNASYGSRWRPTSERQYYSMRKVIIDEIIRRAGGTSDKEALDAVVKAMERDRLRQKSSLDKLIKAIKVGQKATPA